MLKNQFIQIFLIGEMKKNPWLFFKGILLLIPILSIIGLFSTVQIVSTVNQKSFLQNSDYDWIHFSDKEEVNHNLGFLNAEVAILTSTNGGVFYKDSYPIEFYFTKKSSPEILEDSYFNKKNLIDGDFNDLHTDDNSLGFAITYNTAKGLKLKVGDKATILFHIENEVPAYYPITVKAIMKPKYNNNFSRSGLGFSVENKKFINFLKDNNLTYQYAMFGKGEGNIFETGNTVHKIEQFKSSNLDVLSDKNIMNLVFGAMGIIIVYITIYRELNFIVLKRMRTIGILKSMGSSNQIIVKTFWVEQTLKILIASFFASVIMKYVLFEHYIGEYLELRMWFVVTFLFIIVGLASVKIAMNKVKNIISEFSIIEIITKKPEEL